MRLLKILPLLLVVTPVFAQQPSQPNQQQDAPKATKADVDKLVSTIKADPAKKQSYCTIVKMQSEYQQADQQKNEAKLKELDDKMDAAAKSLGPDFDRVMASDLDDAAAKSLDDLNSTCRT